MKILHLNLKKKWFDMILSGEKKEEYRAFKPYWNKRLGAWYESYPQENGYWDAGFREPYFDTIIFRNGYHKNARQMTIELTDYYLGEAVPEWSDNWKGEVYVFLLGKILETKNI